MKNYSYVLAVLFLIGTLTGCETTDLSLDYDRTIDFSRYRTFSWLSPAPGGPNLSYSQSDLIESRVRKYVTRELTARGYQEAPENAADFLVTYHNVLQEKMSFHSIGNYGYGYGPGFYWHSHHHRGFRNYGWGEPYYFQPETYSYYYTEGTLIIDIIDRRSEKLVWRGTSVRVVSESTPEALDRKINEAVTQLLQKFPPPAPTRKEIQIEQTAKKVE